MLTPDQDAAAWTLYEEIRTEQRKRRLKDGDVILALCRQCRSQQPERRPQRHQGTKNAQRTDRG